MKVTASLKLKQVKQAFAAMQKTWRLNKSPTRPATSEASFLSEDAGTQAPLPSDHWIPTQLRVCEV